MVKNNWHTIPPLFQTILEEGKTPAKEMYKVFNMGDRMELYLPEKIVIRGIAISENFAEQK